MKNLPVALGFLCITVSQLVLGICMTTLAARIGGKVKSLDQKASSYLELASVQPSPFRRYPSTHTTYASFTGIDP